MLRLGTAAFIFMVSTSAFGVSDYQWSFDASGNSSYTVSYASSPDVYSGALGATDPSITLIETKRYEISVMDAGSHPVQIIAKAASSNSDVVLLAQGPEVGLLESDPDVNWVDDGMVMDAKVEFTVSASLISAMNQGALIPGYRCGNHPSTMRGNFGTQAPPVPEIIDPIAPHIAPGDARIELEVVASGLQAPLGLSFPDGNPNRFLVYDQVGLVTLWNSGVLAPTPFLDVRSRLVTLGIAGPGSYDERGLLGFALHPSFASNGKCYTYTSEPISGVADFPLSMTGTPDHQSVVAEWTVNGGDPNTVNPASRRELMRIDEPQFNHNGGALKFGLDGNLYISVGDGGNADDEGDGHSAGGNGQDLNKVLGKILRISVDGAGNPSANGQYGIPADNPFVGAAGIDEIFVYGLRNPFSMNFDPDTGKLYVGDVGQNKIEEVDIAASGANYGWPIKEGSFYFHGNGAGDGYVSNIPDVVPDPGNLVEPIAEYDHDDGSSIIGGCVYHGLENSLFGKYITGDFGTSFGTPSGRLFYLASPGVLKEVQIGFPNRNLGYWLKGFAEGPDDALYVLGSKNLGPSGGTGAVLRVQPFTESLPASNFKGQLLLVTLICGLAAGQMFRKVGMKAQGRV